MDSVNEDAPVSPARVEERRLVADFSSPGRRAQATHELAALGAGAVPVLIAVLDGTSRNEFGIPCRASGEALRCALVTARLLGPLAIPLESALAAELANASPSVRAEAAAALGALPALSELSIERLATALDDAPDPATEAAVVILRLGLSTRPSVVEILSRSSRAVHTLGRTRAWMEKDGPSRR